MKIERNRDNTSVDRNKKRYICRQRQLDKYKAIITDRERLELEISMNMEKETQIEMKTGIELEKRD